MARPTKPVAPNVTLSTERTTGRTKSTPEKPITVTVDLGGRQVIISVDDGEQQEVPHSASSGVARWHVDSAGKIIWSNIDSKILGIVWRSKAIPWHVVHPADRPRVQAEWKMILERRTRFAMRFRVELVSGAYVEVILRGEPVLCSDEFCGLTGTMEVCR